MPSELRDNSEARAMAPASREAVSLLPSQQDMAAHWANLKLVGSASTREQEMFGQGFNFQSLESLYGGNIVGIGSGDKLASRFTEVQAKSQLAAKPQELADVDNRPIKSSGYDIKQHGQDKVVETGLQYQAEKPQELTVRDLFEKIGALSLPLQAQVNRRCNQGIQRRVNTPAI